MSDPGAEELHGSRPHVALHDHVLLRAAERNNIRNRFLVFLEEYIRTCTVSGKAGAYIWYDRMWHYWRWTIDDICANSVAQEEIMEFVNKKMTAFPCWYDLCCKKIRFNWAEYCWQEMNAPFNMW